MDFSSIILKWYNHHKRDLPWRQTTDPYLIWLSEIILQQTRVQQGMPYYEKFVENFPTIKHLANASEDQVLQLWQGLGYYSRGRNLHWSAKFIVDKYNGIFPNTFKKIIELKGVGEYTAAAIASFAYDEKVAVLDGNVIRVLTRYFGIAEDVSNPKTIKNLRELASTLLPDKNCADYNQGIMEFGALQCVPSSPDCQHCPLNLSCKAYKDGIVKNLPYKSKKIKVRNRYFNYIVLKSKDKILIHQRTKKDIWQNLYDFPLMEHEVSLLLEKEAIHNFILNLVEDKSNRGISVSEDFKHKLTHQTLHTRFYLIELNQDSQPLKKDHLWVSIDDLHQYAKPILAQNYLNKYIL